MIASVLGIELERESERERGHRMSSLGYGSLSHCTRTMSIRLSETKGDYLLAGRRRTMLIENISHTLWLRSMSHTLTLSHRLCQLKSGL